MGQSYASVSSTIPTWSWYVKDRDDVDATRGGSYSAFGCVIRGIDSLIVGDDNVISGNGNRICGDGNTIIGDGNTILGHRNQDCGNHNEYTEMDAGGGAIYSKLINRSRDINRKEEKYTQLGKRKRDISDQTRIMIDLTGSNEDEPPAKRRRVASHTSSDGQEETVDQIVRSPPSPVATSSTRPSHTPMEQTAVGDFVSSVNHILRGLGRGMEEEEEEEEEAAEEDGLLALMMGGEEEEAEEVDELLALMMGGGEAEEEEEDDLLGQITGSNRPIPVVATQIILPRSESPRPPPRPMERTTVLPQFFTQWYTSLVPDTSGSITYRHRVSYRPTPITRIEQTIPDEIVDEPIEENMAKHQECVICRERIRKTILLPCDHMCLCVTCCIRLLRGSLQARKCPICRAALTGGKRVFVA